MTRPRLQARVFDLKEVEDSESISDMHESFIGTGLVSKPRLIKREISEIDESMDSERRNEEKSDKLRIEIKPIVRIVNQDLIGAPKDIDTKPQNGSDDDVFTMALYQVAAQSYLDPKFLKMKGFFDERYPSPCNIDYATLMTQERKYNCH
jgi:hypothetical protein